MQIGGLACIEAKASDYESEGRTFESFRARHFSKACDTCRDFWLFFGSRGQKTIVRENILPPVGAILPPISFADLEATRRSFPQEVRDDPARETFTLAVSIVRHFFGHQWYLDHVFQDAARSRALAAIKIRQRQNRPAGMPSCSSYNSWHESKSGATNRPARASYCRRGERN